MKAKLFLRDVCPYLLACFLFLGFQNLGNAQLTIQNNTSCTVYVQASQVQNGASPCTRCNVSAVTAIPAWGSWVHPGDPTCGHFTWLGVRWYTSATGLVGISFSPIWEGQCGENQRGGRCNGTLTHATWDIPSSPGPATVTIH